MDKFNKNAVNLSKWGETDFINAGMILQALLSDKELKQLKEDADIAYKNGTPYWKFCLDNIKVSYRREGDCK